MLEPTAAEYFGAMTDSYDSLIRRAVPRYDEMLERLLSYLPPHPQRILELGCGTGNLSLALARRFPDAELVLLDAAPEMLDTTRSRMAAASLQPSARFEHRRFEELDPTLGTFDLVTSSISLHHVADKAPMYHQIRTLMRPQSTFRFADQMRGATEGNHAINWKGWLDFARIDSSEEEVQSLLDHAEAHDHYTPVADHFAMLTAAGFRHVDCVWRNWIWGVITADVDGQD